MYKELEKSKYWINGFCLLIGLLLLSNCKKEERVKETPGIQALSISKDTLIQSFFSQDTFTVSFTLINLDGYRGFKNNQDTIRLSYIDQRDGFLYPARIISPNRPDPTYQINEGTVNIIFPTTCCIYEDGTLPCEPKENSSQPVDYELIFNNNFGQIFDNQIISFHLLCD